MIRRILFVLATLIGGANAEAATFTVTNMNASGAGSLAKAITDANANASADETSDALNVLRVSVGQVVILDCPFCIGTP